MLATKVLLSPSSGMVKDSKVSRKPDPLPAAYSSYNGTTTANNGTTAANNETTTARNGTTAANNDSS